jgi:exosortase/archaeosortase family protein
MLSVFFALSTAVALVVRRPRYEKVVVFLSAVPVGLAVNLVRITATGWAHQTFGSHVAKVLFHDYAGWLMMPLALAVLGLELALLRRLVVRRKVAGPVPVLGPPGSAQITAPAAPDLAGARIRHLSQPVPVAADRASGPGQSGR